VKLFWYYFTTKAFNYIKIVMGLESELIYLFPFSTKNCFIIPVDVAHINAAVCRGKDQ